MLPEDNGGQHYVEHCCVVYLRFDFEADDWVVDRPTVDGYPLDEAHEHGALNEECECSDPDGACEEARRHADTKPLPTGEELITMLRDALGRVA